MKNLKILILVFGVAGLVSMFMPLAEGAPSFFSFFYAADKLVALLVLAGFALPTLMGAMSLTKPFQSWQAIASLAGFVLVAVKLRVWNIIGHFGDSPFQGKLMLGAIVGGVIVSAIAMASPQRN